MQGDAPLPPTSADRLTGPLEPLDGAVNALHDDLNARVPWLWWPLTAPTAGERLDGPRHALYAAHAGLGLAAVGLIAGRRARPRALLAGAALGLASWALFTGAWDRRADRLRDAYDAAVDPSA